MQVYKDGKVLLAGFAHAEGMQADNTGKTTSKLGDFWRTKTYVKPLQMIHPTYPVFPQPYQLGQSLFGGTWNDYNKPFIVQVASCPLRCWYCYCDQDLLDGKTHNETGEEIARYFSISDIIQMWTDAGSPRVLRISGGEPTLAPEFIRDLILEMRYHNALLWIDTNLSTGSAFVNTYNASGWRLPHPKVALSGCFKGFCNQDANLSTGAKFDASGKGLLDRQLEMARQIIEDTDLEMYFYVPGVIHKDWLANSAGIIKEFFNRLRTEVSEYAPLRTYILEVKNYSSTQTDEWGNWMSAIREGRPIDVWQELCEEHYAPELLWLPNNQIDLRAK